MSYSILNDFKVGSQTDNRVGGNVVTQRKGHRRTTVRFRWDAGTV